MMRRILALDDLGREKIAIESIILMRRLAPRSIAPAWDADLQWIVWPDPVCAAEWAERYASDFGGGGPGTDSGERGESGHGGAQVPLHGAP